MFHTAERRQSTKIQYIPNTMVEYGIDEKKMGFKHKHKQKDGREPVALGPIICT
jgi:hypothetical protein